MTKAKHPQSVNITSPDLRAERLSTLRQLMPDLFDGEGALDEKALRQLVAEEAGAVAERFRFEWAGKAQSKRFAFTPSKATLVYDPQRSTNKDGTPNRAGQTLMDNNSENLMIEGDNLEVLKLLQTSYFEQVKCIYIDPPYNTGKDFIYPDNYHQTRQDYWQQNGTTQEGVRLKAVTESSGRRHSDWLNFMQSRLLLARNMLREDGVIFVSIDDNEAHNLRKLMDEVFGEENFVDTIIWKKRYGGGAKEKYLITLHEYKLMYAKDINILPEIFTKIDSSSIERYYKLSDENESVRGRFRTHPLEATKSMGDRPNLVFPITAPDGSEIMPKRQWLWSKENVEEALKNGELYFFQKSGIWNVHTKQYLKNKKGELRKSKIQNIFDDIFTQHGTNEIIALLKNAHFFPFPKPTRLIEKLLNIATNERDDEVVLDLFAGSGTTAHAVMQKNAEDGGKRRYICVQIPEAIGEHEEARKAGYKTIADITIERLKRAGAKLKQENPEWQGDTGFRVLKLAPSHFAQNTFVPDPEKSDPENIAALENHLVQAAQQRLFGEDSVENVVTEIALKNGFGLFYTLERLEDFRHNALYRLHGNHKSALLCLDNALEASTLEALKHHRDSQLMVRKSALDTTKKFELQIAFGGNLWMV